MLAVNLYCVKITDFCNKTVQVPKKMAGGDFTKNQLGYKNNSLAAAYRRNQWLMEKQRQRLSRGLYL